MTCPTKHLYNDIQTPDIRAAAAHNVRIKDDVTHKTSTFIALVLSTEVIGPGHVGQSPVCPLEVWNNVGHAPVKRQLDEQTKRRQWLLWKSSSLRG